MLRTSVSMSRLHNLPGDLARADLFVRLLSVASDFGPSQEAARKASLMETLALGQEVHSESNMQIMLPVEGVERKVCSLLAPL